ncbi:urea transporter [Nitrosophilus labii]|uniref:urea transporter n=1 Tax=Nitrosophilus labii TaxID=2706014 RepID=UPI0024845A69|nr:urea transporter [Nitrosophilus labii]
MAGFKSFKSYINSILAAYAEVLFIENKKIGILLLIVTFINPNIAISGLLGVIFVLIFAAYIRMDPEFLESGILYL